MASVRGEEEGQEEDEEESKAQIAVLVLDNGVKLAATVGQSKECPAFTKLELKGNGIPL